MKVIVLLAVIGCAVAFEEISLRYHSRYGIKEYERIKAVEEAADFDGARIGGGVFAELGQHPYMVGLLISLDIGFTSVCGASLVSNTRLVTAAHCWWDGENQGLAMLAVLGSATLTQGGTRVYATNVQMQSMFNPENLNHDIAVVHIPWVAYSSVIGPVAIPTGGTTILSFAGNIATAVGYGVTTDSEALSNPVLRRINLQVISNIACAQSYGFYVIDTTLCTSGQGFVGICGGDSGGPLTLVIGGQRTLIGVTSFHHGFGCRAGFPSAYSRVTSYSAWIQARL